MKIGVFNESIFDLYPAAFHPFCLYYYILITFRSITCVHVKKGKSTWIILLSAIFHSSVRVPWTIITYRFELRGRRKKKKTETRNYPRSRKGATRNILRRFLYIICVVRLITRTFVSPAGPSCRPRIYIYSHTGGERKQVLGKYRWKAGEGLITRN